MFFKTNYRLMQVKSIAECSKASILQYFRPSFSYHLSLRSLFCLFLSGRFTQVLLYMLLQGKHPTSYGKYSRHLKGKINFTSYVLRRALLFSLDLAISKKTGLKIVAICLSPLQRKNIDTTFLFIIAYKAVSIFFILVID